MKRIPVLFLMIAVCCITTAQAAITLPKIFTDNMVLQRDKAVTIWGQADKGETITLSFNGQKIRSRADKNGQWSVVLQPMSYGGPFDMVITGKKESVSFRNILIGDVWICSGQSNMEWIIRNTNNAGQETAAANYPKIRLFTVQKAMSYRPEKDLQGGAWQECNPQTVADFSAVAYFFGRKLNKELNIPIGLINSSWGGTNVQTWISWDVMSKKEGYQNTDLAQLVKDQAGIKAKMEQFRQSLKDDKGMAEKWYDPAAAVTGWKAIQLPTLWEQTEIGNADGIVWFKKEFDLPASLEGKAATLSLGPIDDIDATYVNGKQAGTTDGWNTDRMYTLDASLLKAGKNTIVVRVTDNGGGGGLYGKPEQLYITAGGQQITLAGEWQYKPAALNTAFGIKDAGPNSFPSQLYNAMIAPIIQYAIKGGIWYQGEANTWEAYRYRKLFPEMINDWRSKWGYTFPFFWVQLANFMKADSLPAQSDWAELREAQSMTLSLPQTGQAVIIDIGEAADIHPRNKQDVGYRLALAALKVAYAKELVYAGPQYQSMTTNGNKIVLSFSNTGGGLMAKDKYGYLKGFAIAGADQKFVWAKAMVDGDKVIVYSDTIANPVAVRYAWGNNPDDANFYNKEGLPASPFRTDTWNGISQGKP